jgi:hypothetical protein
MHGTINVNPVDAGSFPLQTTLLLQGSFIVTETGQLADPTTVTLYLTAPNQPQQVIIGGSIIRASLGVYTYTLTPTDSGVWQGTWQGTGAVTATRDFSFSILPSSNIPG